MFELKINYKAEKQLVATAKETLIFMHMDHMIYVIKMQSLAEIAFNLNLNRLAHCADVVWSVNHRPNIIIGLISDDNVHNEKESRRNSL